MGPLCAVACYLRTVTPDPAPSVLSYFRETEIIVAYLALATAGEIFFQQPAFLCFLVNLLFYLLAKLLENNYMYSYSEIFRFNRQWCWIISVKYWAKLCQN